MTTTCASNVNIRIAVLNVAVSYIYICLARWTGICATHVFESHLRQAKFFLSLIDSGNLFRIESAMWLNALSLNEVLIGETTNMFSDSERRSQLGTWSMMSDAKSFGCLFD